MTLPTVTPEQHDWLHSRVYVAIHKHVRDVPAAISLARDAVLALFDVCGDSIDGPCDCGRCHP